MKNLGTLLLVDTSSYPYHASHTLSTLLTPANDPTKFHGSVVADAYIPYNLGIPVYAPVWTYMIESEEALSSKKCKQKIETNQIFPNPVNSFLHITCSNCDFLNYSIFNMHGILVKNGIVENRKIDLSDLHSGIYFFKIEDITFSNTIIIKE